MPRIWLESLDGSRVLTFLVCHGNVPAYLLRPLPYDEESETMSFLRFDHAEELLPDPSGSVALDVYREGGIVTH